MTTSCVKYLNRANGGWFTVRNLSGAGAITLCILVLVVCFSSFDTSSVAPHLFRSSSVAGLPHCREPLSLNIPSAFSYALQNFPGIHRQVVHYNFTLNHPNDAVFDILTPQVTKEGVPGSFDYVADYISNRGIWEEGNTRFFATKLEECRLLHQGNKDKCHFIDAGANLGWYSVVMGSLGYPVTAFEANAMTYAMTYATLKLAGNAVYQGSKVPEVRLIPFGLGEVYQHCMLYSLTNNLYGSGSVYCPSTTNPTFGGVYELRGDVHIVPGECFLSDIDHIYAMKIDVEGFEIPALRGMRDLFRRTPPKYILAEFCGAHQRRQGFTGVKFVEEFEELGYDCRLNVKGNMEPIKSLAEEDDKLEKVLEGEMVCTYTKDAPHHV